MVDMTYINKSSSGSSMKLQESEGVLWPEPLRITVLTYQGELLLTGFSDVFLFLSGSLAKKSCLLFIDWISLFIP